MRVRKLIVAVAMSLIAGVVTLTPSVEVAQAAPISVNPNDMESVRAAYLNSYLPAQSVAPGWTGNVSSCSPGTTTAAHRDATLTTINYFRALAGLGQVTESAAATTAAQKSALVMAANGKIDHYPTTAWTCNSGAQAGYGSAAAESNLALVWSSVPPTVNGPGQIVQFMGDESVSNVGHRAWFLYPGLSSVGVGFAGPAASPPGAQWPYGAYSVVKIFGSDTGMSTAPNSSAVGFPSAGYFPYENLPSTRQWSFHQQGVDFSSKTVSVTRNGTNVPVTVVNRTTTTGYPYSRIVWTMPTYTAPTGAGVDTYVISISGLPSYTVRVFQASYVAPNTQPSTACGAPAGQSCLFRFYNTRTMAHFYTTDVAERDHVLATWPHFTYEGVTGWVITGTASQDANQTPVYRFYNHITMAHFYTTSATERAKVNATWPDRFIDEGPKFVAYSTQIPGTVPVFRFYNHVTMAHFYTTDPVERARVNATWPDKFIDEGIAYYIFPS